MSVSRAIWDITAGRSTEAFAIKTFQDAEITLNLRQRNAMTAIRRMEMAALRLVQSKPAAAGHAALLPERFMARHTIRKTGAFPHL